MWHQENIWIIPTMSINLDYYKTFYFVAKYANLTMAARQMGANQPNVTRVIKLLEAQIGNTLFTRGKTGMTLTPSGRRLFEQIYPAIERIANAEYDIKANATLKKGTVALGVTEIALRCFLLPVLGEFHRLYPGVRFRIYNHSTQESVDALKAGLVDMAIVTSPVIPCDNASILELKRFHEVPVCGSLFKSLPRHTITLTELSGLPLISLRHGSASYSFYTEQFAKHGLTFLPDIEAATADQIIPLVHQNLGIGFIPEDFLSEVRDGICQLTLAEDIPDRTICLVTGKELPFNLAAMRLRESILNASSSK